MIISCLATNQISFRSRILHIGQRGCSIEQLYYDLASAKLQGAQGIILRWIWPSRFVSYCWWICIPFLRFPLLHHNLDLRKLVRKGSEWFHVLIAASKQSVSTNPQPERKAEQNDKDRLHKCVIELLSQRTLSFECSENDLLQTNVVGTLQESLWSSATSMIWTSWDQAIPLR